MKKTILVADDEYAIRELVELTLEEDYIVIKAEDGEEALEKANNEANRPDLIILDVMMPKMDGLQAIREIMAANPEQEIIVCTSAGQEKIVNEAVEAGAKELILKPFDMVEVKEITNKYLSKGGE